MGPSSIRHPGAPVPNRLAEETSPYLLQHAGNPVDWYPWGEEALSLARAEDKPILLSIGYSACHWCHVMERESFEDPETAERMNHGFVCIKVDREERPDLDSIYMRAVQVTTGGGGWPLTAFLTPDGRYFYGGTYFPPEPRYGMPSFRQLLAAVLDAYLNRRDEVEEGADRILGLLRDTSPSEAGPRVSAAAIRTAEDGAEESGPEARLAALGPSALRQAALTLAGRFDPLHGGFGPAPKFPQPATLDFLLRYHVRSGEPRALDMALTTLRAMARGGIRDHLGGGFHRYSVDDRWMVPHFEKMLYDNGLLARVYLHAFQITGEDELKEVVTSTLDYLLDDLLDPEGGFYSARDADSEGEEGVFYLWTPDQIRSVLGEEEGVAFCRTYGVSDGGNFEGRNILNLMAHLPAPERGESLMGRASTPGMAAAREALRKARGRREEPFRDEKVLVAWNSFVLRALAEAGPVLGREDYLEAATRTAEFLLGALGRNGGLYRSWKEGRPRVGAFLEDYAGLGNALLALHESTLETRWLLESKRLSEQMLDLFWEDGEGQFYDTPRDGEVLVVRPRDVMDNATPSGNSLAVELLLRAHAVFGLPRFRDIALRCLIRELESMARIPSAFGELLSALDRALDPPLEVVLLAGENGGPGVRELLAAAHREYLPSRVVVGGGPGLLGQVPLLQGRNPVGGMATAYVCRGLACSLPIHDPRELVSELKADGPGGRRPQGKPSLDGEA